MRPVPPARCVLFAVALGFAAAFAPASAQAGPYEDGEAALIFPMTGNYHTAKRARRRISSRKTISYRKLLAFVGLEIGLGLTQGKHNGAGLEPKPGAVGKGATHGWMGAVHR